MTTSNSSTGSVRPYTAIQLVEEACSRAGISPSKLTSEIVEKSLDQMNLLFTSLVNRGIQLWKRQMSLVPCYLNEEQVTLPPYTNSVLSLNRRTMFRQTGASFSDAGGTASLAFDDDFDTACDQTSTNGSIGAQFTTAVQVTTIGVLFGAAGMFGLFFEYSNDGVTYTSLTSTTVIAADRQWLWVDMSGAPSALYWRVRSVSDSDALSVRELYLGNTPQEIVLGPWNIDDYTAMPNKAQGGQVLNWYQQRDRDAPVLLVWPVPNNLAKYDVLVLWTHEMLNDVTEVTQSLDVPRRWYDAITAMLARRLCRSLEEADMARYPMLVSEEQEATMLAAAEERDNSPVNFDTGIAVYTR
jgi:hypothetical protein